jgi:hypothetical protein
MASFEDAGDGGAAPGQLLVAFESVVVDQMKSFLQAVGKEFPIMNKFFSKIKDVPSIRKNISLIVLITYTSIFGKRPQGLELSDQGKVEDVRAASNLNILVQSVLDQANQELNIDAETILRGKRGDAAMHIHALVKLLQQLLDMNADLGDPTFDGEGGLDDPANEAFPGVENQRPHTAPGGSRSRVAGGMGVAGAGGVAGMGPMGADGLGGMAGAPYEAGLRSAGKVDMVARMEEQTQALFGQAKKQRAARLRRADRVHARRQEARERNMRHRERMRMIKKLRQQGDLERWHLGNQMRVEAEKQQNSNELISRVLKELGKDVREEDAMNAEYLQRLEQQRISQAASTSALFSDRSEMIKQMAEEAEEYQSRMLKEQERYMEGVMREAEVKQKVNLEAKLQQLNMVEEECLAQSREAQISLAELFNLDTYKYVTKDRVTGVSKSPFERTLKKIRSNALTLRQQQNRKMKAKKLKMAYAGSKPVASIV